MSLTDAEIALIAEWEPINSGFGRLNPETAARIRKISDNLSSRGDLGCDIVEDDGLSNYFSLFVYRIADKPRYILAQKVDGLLIYLSACAPVAVMGRSRRLVSPAVAALEPLSICTILDPDELKGDLEERASKSICEAGYVFLSREEVAKPLPTGVVPYEYCFSPEPWDRIYHALFANTD